MTSGMNYETRVETYYENGMLESVNYELVERNTRELFSNIDNAVFAGEIIVTEEGYSVKLGQTETGIQSSQSLVDLLSLVPISSLPNLVSAIKSGVISFNDDDGISVRNPTMDMLLSLIPPEGVTALIEALRSGSIRFEDSNESKPIERFESGVLEPLVEYEEERIGEDYD